MTCLNRLEPSDLAMLLSLVPTNRIGAIIRLNRTTRYANTLNVVEMLVQLAELSMARTTTGEAGRSRVPASSPGVPASSDSMRTSPAGAR